jgi:hypothetical protein
VIQFTLAAKLESLLDYDLVINFLQLSKLLTTDWKMHTCSEAREPSGLRSHRKSPALTCMCRPVSLIAPHVSFVDSNSIGTSPPHALETIPIGIGPIVLWLSLVLILVLFAADLPADYTGKANVGEKVMGFQARVAVALCHYDVLCYRHSWRSKASKLLIQ